MRVMIVNPRFHLPIDTRTTPHLGLAYLAAVSEQRGDEVLLFDADKDFWLNWQRTFKVAFKTIFPKKEKTGLRQSIKLGQII